MIGPTRSTPELTGPDLALVLEWSDVIAYAESLCKHWRASAKPGQPPIRVALERIGFERSDSPMSIAVLTFVRAVGQRDLAPDQRFFRTLAVSRDLVDHALTPAVWQYPIERAVQQLVAETPTFVGLREDGDEPWEPDRHVDCPGCGRPMPPNGDCATCEGD